MIDRKFKFLAINPCNNKVYTEDNAIIFCAKDKALLKTLNAYKGECIRLGCDDSHIESINLLINRIYKYQQDNPDLCKIPDTNTQCEIDRCIGGKI